MVQASAPGKCILFGEHAVVYGQPAVAVAIDQRMNVNLELNSDWRIDGMTFDPIFNHWKVTSDKSVNYITKFEKF